MLKNTLKDRHLNKKISLKEKTKRLLITYARKIKIAK